MADSKTNRQVKKYTDTYIYNKFSAYNQQLLAAITKAERIDKNTEGFMEDVVLEVKRSKAPAYLLKVLTSSNCVLLYPKEPLPRMFKVFCAKDPKGGGKIKTFIDCTGVLNYNDSTRRYKTHVDVLIANLVEAKVNMVYFMIPRAYITKSAYMITATRIYAKLLTHLIDYVGNISVIPGNREKMMYYAAKFFLYAVLQVSDDEERINDLASRAVDVKGTEAKVFDIMADLEDNFSSVPAFLLYIQKIFKLDKLTMSLFIEKWMFLYGPSTVLGIEFLPAFISMITNAYLGVFLNNQKSIEKIASKDMITLGKETIYDNAGIR